MKSPAIFYLVFIHYLANSSIYYFLLEAEESVKIKKLSRASPYLPAV
jgi:hypothetical protein